MAAWPACQRWLAVGIAGPIASAVAQETGGYGVDPAGVEAVTHLLLRLGEGAPMLAALGIVWQLARASHGWSLPPVRVVHTLDPETLAQVRQVARCDRHTDHTDHTEPRVGAS